MTVKKLIKILQGYRPNATVYISFVDENGEFTELGSVDERDIYNIAGASDSISITPTPTMWDYYNQEEYMAELKKQRQQHRNILKRQNNDRQKRNNAS